MDESFEIPVSYRDEELSFKAKLLVLGYTHKIQVEVNELDILFEPDEERNYRATLDPSQLDRDYKVDIGLIKAIAEAIESIVK